jgi:hypothetical protein
MKMATILTPCFQTLQTAGLREIFASATSGVNTITELNYQEYWSYTGLVTRGVISPYSTGQSFSLPLLQFIAACVYFVSTKLLEMHLIITGENRSLTAWKIIYSIKQSRNGDLQ